MRNIVLTRRNPELAAAVRTVVPDARVETLDADARAQGGSGAWYFIDWLLDDTSGLELCRRLRASEATRGSHITMVLESDDQTARARALEAGADDYMTGPLTGERLAARLREYVAIDGSEPAPARFGGGITLDTVAHQARWQDRVIPLRPREMRVLEVFLTHPDRLLSRMKIIALLGKDAEIGDERTVDKWVGCLRATLDKHGLGGSLRTVRSLGYVFDSPSA